MRFNLQTFSLGSFGSGRTCRMSGHAQDGHRPPPRFGRRLARHEVGSRGWIVFSLSRALIMVLQRLTRLFAQRRPAHFLRRRLSGFAALLSVTTLYLAIASAAAPGLTMRYSSHMSRLRILFFPFAHLRRPTITVVVILDSNCECFLYALLHWRVTRRSYHGRPTGLVVLRNTP